MNIRAASYARICVPARSTTDSERTIMLHVFTLLSVPEYSADALVRSIRQGGEWHAIARHLLPELIATDLLEHRASDMPPFLLSVPEYSADALVRSIRQGGEWHAI